MFLYSSFFIIHVIFQYRNIYLTEQAVLIYSYIQLTIETSEDIEYMFLSININRYFHIFS